MQYIEYYIYFLVRIKTIISGVCESLRYYIKHYYVIKVMKKIWTLDLKMDTGFKKRINHRRTNLSTITHDGDRRREREGDDRNNRTRSAGRCYQTRSLCQVNNTPLYQQHRRS